MEINLPQIPFEFYLAASPVFILAIGSLVAMLQSVVPVFAKPGWVKAVMFATLFAALGCTLAYFGQEQTSFLEGAYLSEALAKLGFVLILTIGITVALLFNSTYLANNFFRGEIASLYMLVILGAIVLVAADDLISLFTGLEIASIGLYALVGYIQPNRRSMEGAIKYFVLGAFATGFLLFGFALLYAGTGSLNVAEIVQVFSSQTDHPWIQLGALFTVVGLGFKLALAPFHLWGPDAYEGAPTGLTAFMATAVKVMVLILMLRFMAIGMQHMSDVWMPALLFLAGLSMLLGNIMALVQSSIKRMLAYSSIAHSGYMAVAICAIGAQSGELPVAAVLFYITGYSIITLGAFAVLMWFESQGAENLHLDDLAGLAKEYPWASFAMATFMFSFSGFPPTVGFISKFFVFNAAIKSDLYGLVLIGVLGSSIALYYYLRVLVKMYMAPPVVSAAVIQPKRSYMLCAIAGGALLLTVAMGTVLPGKLFEMTKKASGSIVSH